MSEPLSSTSFTVTAQMLAQVPGYCDQATLQQMLDDGLILMVVNGSVDGTGHLILTHKNGTTFDAGLVKGANGVAGVVGTGTFAGQSLKIWGGTGTTDASGNFTINYTAAGFTAAPIINVTPKTASLATASAYVPQVTTPSTTGATCKLTLPNTATLSVLGINVLGVANMNAPAGVVCDITAIGY